MFDPILTRVRPALLALATVLGVCAAGAAPRFIGQGGAIAFVQKNNVVRFDVNLRAVERAGLFVSSKLFRVARNLEPAGRR